ncbi:MAG TPA: 16S rRNA (cytosine(1402)-N(4))-methyltransferase RsmH [Epulopiscium sp.]|nr:16S rRNA (cytosine(1402)-N(4))-methyltransferase RsmH [Candidatus Epulonipiscium sp.]
MEFHHVSVLLNECIEGLNIKENGIYVDGTLGGAGHSKEICGHLNKDGQLVGIDQDINAINASREKLAHEACKITLIESNFSDVTKQLENVGITQIDGMLLDLGVSSHQLDEPMRGFSYMHDAPLDMRMDQNTKFTAYDVVNKYSEEALEDVIKKYGEENWSKRIVKFICEYRADKPIETTYELVEIIKKAVPKGARRDGPHPAKRTFQAIRIEVNNELGIIENTILDIIKVLKPGGRLCIITFHSLEDRIVKQTYKKIENPCTCPREFPVCVCQQKSQIKIITRKPILPSDAEIEENPRSRSAKLRIIEKR